MPKMIDPKVGIARGTERKPRMFYLPEDVDEALRRTALHESLRFGRTVTQNEVVARAIIDRVGKIFGTRYATRLYKQYFNGIAPLRSDHSKLPEISILTREQFGNNEEDEE